MEPEDRFAQAGLVFHFWANGSAFLADDSPERVWMDDRICRRYDRNPTHIAAVIGKACALAAVRPQRPRAAPPPRGEVAAPPLARDANPYKAGYTQDPDAEERE